MTSNKSSSSCAVIIVTHNSEVHIAKTISCLHNQTLCPDQIILVDSGSTTLSYLNSYQCSLQKIQTDVFFHSNIGFCKGNNEGINKMKPSTKYVLFLNPDAFLTPTFLEKAISFMEEPQNQGYAVLSGTLLGYDIHKDQPTNTYDSTGIFQKWYGRWHDRDKGRNYDPQKYQQPEDVPALCGALMLCRKKALRDVLIRGIEVFDNTFYMYKEDIDLSLRLRKAGWKLIFMPELLAYHCRGWDSSRSKIPKKLRLLSSKNEIKIHMRFFSPFVVYSCIKYLFVRIFNF